MKKNKKGFTLAELVAVLVIITILTLIVSPLILTLVNRTKIVANKRSVDAYGKAVEVSILSYLMDNGKYPSDLTTLSVEYTGKEVICNVMSLNKNGSIYLSECSVNGTEVKDSTTEDGWYHYGTLEVVIYDTYNIGDQVTYNGIDFYIIENSNEKKDSVTLLKAEPLIREAGAEPVNNIQPYDYKVTLTKNVINNDYKNILADNNVTYDKTTFGATSDYYKSSTIKKIVDEWVNENINVSDLKDARLITLDDLKKLGYKNLTLKDFLELNGIDTTNMTEDDMWTTFFQKNGNDISTMTDEEIHNLKEQYNLTFQKNVITTSNVPTWVYNESYEYWTMNPIEGVPEIDSSSYVWYISNSGNPDLAGVGSSYAIRPVITILKSAL